jgi:hypothetical protein
MPDPNTDETFDKGIAKQTIAGQQSHESEYGEQGRQTDGSGGQPIGGNDSGTGSGTPLSQGADFGNEAATGEAQSGSGAEPPRSMGTKGNEFGQFADHDRSGQQGQSGTGQADLGNQSGATLSGHTDQQDFGNDQPGRVGGAGQDSGFGKANIGSPGSTGEGFIGSQGSGSDDLINRQGAGSASSAKATDGIDFAEQGRGASEEQDETSGEDRSG